MDFYTSVIQHRNKILVRGYKDGKRYQRQVDYKPYLFVNTSKDSKYRTINGQYVDRVDFDSIYDAKQFISKYQDVSGFPIYGMTNFQYTYIHDNYPKIQYDSSMINTCIIDIEVDTENGYPDLEKTDNAITAITMQYKTIVFALGYGQFETQDNNVKYIKCKDEHDLLTKFIKIWSSDPYRPDVITGWNVELFDIPYIVGRINVVLGNDQCKKISPWGFFEQRKFVSMNKENVVHIPAGITILDYYNLYKKFTYQQQESYKLDHICHVELGERKLDYSEYESLAGLYKNDHQKFMEYNIRDCALVGKLDDKMKLLELVYTFAYDSGVNYIDSLTSVRSWDVIIHNYLIDRAVVVPNKSVNQLDANRTPVGAYVKDPQRGMFDWVVSFDLTSLYPHLIMSYNISPDTFRGKHATTFTTEQLLNGAATELHDYLNDNNLSFAANSCFYTKDKQGFLGALMEDLFNKRKQYKQQMIEYQKQIQTIDSKSDYQQYQMLTNEVARLNNLQLAIKIKLNSCYGALGNLYFRWHDFNFAESITMSGQLTIRWAETKINQYLNKLLATENVDYCIASDTDSIYINMKPFVEKTKLQDKNQIVRTIDKFCDQQIQPFLNKIYQQLAEYMRCYKQGLHMKRESISDRGIFIAKKRYIVNVHNNEGVQYDKPKLKMMGIEAVRSSTPSSCRQSIKQALEVILTSDEQTLIEFVERFRKQFNQLPFEEIAFPRGINNLDQYKDSVTIYKKATPIHVRGALMYNRLLETNNLNNKFNPIFDKEKIKFCYLIMPNPTRENVISVPVTLPKQLGLDQYIDREMMFDKAFVEPIKTILDCIGWQLEKKTTLGAFFQ